MASIRELRGKWQVQIRLKGFPAVVETFDRKTDAKLWSAATESSMREGRWFPRRVATDRTLADAIDRFVADHLPGRGDKDTEGPRLAWWRSELGAYALVNLTPSLIAEARDKLAKTPVPSTAKAPPKSAPRPRAQSTVNRYLAILSTVLTYAVKDWGWLEDSPVRRVRKLKEPPGRVRWLTPDELRRLLDSCRDGPDWLPFFVELSLATAVRLSELAERRLDDVHIDRQRMLLTETKNGERRGVRLSKPAMAAIKAWLLVRPAVESPLLFPHTKGFQKRWAAAKARAQIEDFHFHDLRHTAASYLAMQGATLSEIAEVLGHKTLAMVKRYAHLAESHVDRVVDRVGDAIEQAKKGATKPPPAREAGASPRAKGRARGSTA